MPKKKDEWDIREDMNPPKNLERAVKADMKRFMKTMTDSSEFKSMSKKQKEDMAKSIPAMITCGYTMAVMIAALSEFAKPNKKVRGKRK